MTLPRITTTVLAAAALFLVTAKPGAAQQDMNAVAEGARAFNQTCTRCHNARPATERSDAEWKMIVSHMRARANLPASRARAILAFLQATNGSEGSGTAASRHDPGPSSASEGDGGEGERAESPSRRPAAGSGLPWLVLPERVADYLARLQGSSREEDPG